MLGTAVPSLRNPASFSWKHIGPHNPSQSCQQLLSVNSIIFHFGLQGHDPALILRWFGRYVLRRNRLYPWLDLSFMVLSPNTEHATLSPRFSRDTSEHDRTVTACEPLTTHPSSACTTSFPAGVKAPRRCTPQASLGDTPHVPIANVPEDGWLGG